MSALQQYLPSLESFGFFWIFKDLEFLESFGIFWNLLESFRIFSNPLESFGILLESFGIFEQLGRPKTQEFLRVI